MFQVQTLKSGSILDLVLTNLSNLIANVTVEHTSTTSDHHLVSFSVICNSQSYQPKPRHVWSYSKADLTSLHNYLLDTDLCDVFSSMEAETACGHLPSASLFPELLYHSISQPKYFNLEIRHKIKGVYSQRRRAR